MNEVHPTLIGVKFRRVMQPVQYESAEAEVTFTTTSQPGADLAANAENLLNTASQIVLAKLGLLPADAPAAPTKRGPGRPPKNPPKDETEPKAESVEQTAGRVLQEAVAESAAKAQPADPEPSKDIDKDLTDEFADPPAEPAKPIEDKFLQEECGKAAKVIGADKVKNLFQTKYGATRVSLLKPEERPLFLQDLAKQVADKQAADKV